MLTLLLTIAGTLVLLMALGALWGAAVWLWETLR